MKLYCKIGSLPGKHFYVFSEKGHSLRKWPTLGDFFYVRDPRERYGDKEYVHLLEIRETGNGTLYVCERF